VDVDPTTADARTLVGASASPTSPSVPPDRGVVPLAATPPSGIAATSPTGVVVPDPAAVPAARHGATSEEQRRRREELITMRAPLPGPTVLRMVCGVGMAMLAVLSLAGGVLLLLLWQQDRSSGVLTTQIDRTWELIARLQQIEVVVALLIVPFATAWAAMATWNVRRATGARRNPFLVAATIPVAVALSWYAGHRVVAEADEWLGTTIGLVLQILPLALPLIALERVAAATEAARRPLRGGTALVAVMLVQLSVLDGLSTVEETSDAAVWGRLGAYLVIAALVQAMAALALNEGARNIEDATLHRFNLRRTYGAQVVGAAQR
jgi:hypothetical protein